MIDIIGLVAIGVAAFVATNIDDIFVLMIFLFFACLSRSPNSTSSVPRDRFPSSYRVLGSLIVLAVPTYVIGLLGIVPIAIGIKNLIEIRKKDKSITRQVVQHE